MSWSNRFVRYHKQQTDSAIHRAFAQLLAVDADTAAKFDEMLHCVRNRAPRMLEAPVLNGRHPGVEALVNLSRFSGAHIRPAADWAGTTSSWRATVSLLTRHLVCKYEVPMFLGSAWYAVDPGADTKRGWFVAHSHGASFRSLDLPIMMTRKMERIFLASHDHLGIEEAIRRAELLALRAPAEIVQAVLSTALATDLSNSEFWRTVWIFLIANANNIDMAQVGPLIDFIQAIRHARVVMETPAGTVELDPPQPEFSMKGRTVQSMLRLMQDWHRSLGVGSADLAWTPSPLSPMLLEEPRQDPSAPPKRWQIMELTNSEQLRIEGAALHHCVASYAERCCRGMSRIWSLRSWRGDKVRHVLTIEIDPKRHAVVQARGSANRFPSGRPLQILQGWADRERLKMAI